MSDAGANRSRRSLRLTEGGAFLGALLAGAFVLAAVALEVVSGLNANSRVPAWADQAVPLAWPRPARVAWWLAVVRGLWVRSGSCSAGPGFLSAVSWWWCR